MKLRLRRNKRHLAAVPTLTPTNYWEITEEHFDLASKMGLTPVEFADYVVDEPRTDDNMATYEKAGTWVPTNIGPILIASKWVILNYQAYLGGCLYRVPVKKYITVREYNQNSIIGDRIIRATT